MFCALSSLCPGFGDASALVSDVGGEKIFVAELAIFDILVSEGNSMIEHGHPGCATIGGRNLTGKFHDGRNFGS